MKKRKTQPKPNTWFIKVRGSYLPASWQAWALYVPFTAFLIMVIRSASMNSDTPADALYAIFPQFVCAGIVMTWIASKTSK